MKASEVSASIVAAMAANEPLLIMGGPGVGKTESAYAAAGAAGYELCVYHAAYRSELDVMGLPGVVDGVTTYAKPAGLPGDGKVLLVLDEVTNAPPQTQGALYQLVLERAVAGFKLGPDVRIVATGNRVSDRGVAHKMADPLIDRFFVVDFEVDLGDWCAWAVAHGVDPRVIAFVRFRPELLHNHDTSRKCHAFPTPRGWAKVSAMLPHLGPAILHDMIKGKVGDAAAIEFMAFLRLCQTMPSPDAILMNPGTAEVPSNPSILYALACALARRADGTNWGRVMTYCNRMPAIYQAALVKDASARVPALCNSPEFITWASLNG